MVFGNGKTPYAGKQEKEVGAPCNGILPFGFLCAISCNCGRISPASQCTGKDCQPREGAGQQKNASWPPKSKNSRVLPWVEVYIMFKRIALLPLLVCCLMLGACLPDSQSKNEIAVVDLGKLIRDSEPGKQAQAFLEGIQEDFNARLMAQQKKVQANPDDQKAMQALETMYVSMQQRMQTEEQNVSNNLLEQILQTVKTFRQAKGYKAVLRSEGVVDYDAALDVTPLVLDEVNKLKMDFKPVTTDQPAMEPEAVAPKTPEKAQSAAPAAEAVQGQADKAAAQPKPEAKADAAKTESSETAPAKAAGK